MLTLLVTDEEGSELAGNREARRGWKTRARPSSLIAMCYMCTYVLYAWPLYS